MGVHTDSDDYERQPRRLADHRGVSVGQALTDLLHRELEREGLFSVEDEGVRRARLLVEHYRKREALLPFEEQDARRRRREEFMVAVRDIQRRVAELPVLDPRPVEQIMRDMYDEDGLPR